MKELSIEEKAKRYDEVIELVNSKWHYRNQPCFIDVSEIFPELKESEDEKIRKELIAIYSVGARVNAKTGDILDRDIVAWLEKQGDKNSQVILPTFTFDDILALQCCMETVKKVQEDKDLYENLMTSTVGCMMLTT